MTSQDIDGKLKRVLELFLTPSYNVVSPTYLDLLLTHALEYIKDATKVDIFQNWVLQALEVWSTGTKPNQAIITFTLKLIGVISHNEFQFCYWNAGHVYDRIREIFDLRRNDLPPSVQMGYVTLLSNLITHENGRKWVISSGVWRDVVKYAHWSHTMYVTRESHKFVWALLLAESKNVDLCKDIISVAAEPLMMKTEKKHSFPAFEDSYLDENKLLCPTLDLLTSILENTLFVSMDNTIPQLLEEVTKLEAQAKALFEACISTRLLQHVNKLVFLTMFSKFKCAINTHTLELDDEVADKFFAGLCYVNMMLVSKEYVLEIVKLNKIGMIYWKKLFALHTFKPCRQHKFEHQAICLMLLPLCSCVKYTYIQHDLFDTFIDKIFGVTCTAVQRLGYAIRSILVKGHLPVEQIAKNAVDVILEIIDIMDRDVAVITFQMLCHVLKNYVPDLNECDSIPKPSEFSNSSTSGNFQRRSGVVCILDGDPIVERPMLLSAILNGLIVMTEKFKLKWQECVETICVLSLAHGIVNHPGVLPKICVQALNLVKLAIQNFMPPHLALLIDKDNHMNELGPSLFKRIHDPSWEVRDSVLEVLNTIAVISEDKYPAFQDFLLESEFLPLAIEIAANDGESYVRASAITFISTTVRINKLWEHTLHRLNLLELALKLLREETEATVRREAVKLIKELYIHRKWSKQTIAEMTHAMTVAAVLDLHWEVKRNALGFWKQFIKSHLSDQGMLDGAFPNVTFSKEHRKIVALNETEIKIRLNKTLDELAREGCLGVLLMTLEDDSDFEVSKASAEIINRLKYFLIRYKLDEPLPSVPLPNNSAIIDSSYVKPAVTLSNNHTSMECSDNAYSVINEIVDIDDASLLASIYKNSMKVDGEKERNEEQTLRKVLRVTKNDYLRATLKCDISVYIEERNRWLKTYTNSLESVVEDILTAHEQGNINSMDCY